MNKQEIVKRDFGSFHSSNVQELLELKDDLYSPPFIPVKLPVFEFESPFPFGRKTKKKFFYIEEACCFLNHGAFGAVLKPALETVKLWQEYVEKQPLRFFDRELMPHLVYITKKLAKFVDCDARDLVLINNATFGTNSVLTSLSFKPGDVILTFNVTYGAVKKLVKHVCERTGAVNVEAQIDFPVSGKQQILQTLSQFLDSHPAKLAIIDHIPSNTPFVMPVEEMVDMCRTRGVLSFIDGAHSLGNLNLSLSQLQPDFYVTNAHKWLAAPKGAAIMYVRRELQPIIHPAVVSHGLGSGFNSEFIWSGLHDYSPLLSLHTVLDFWEAVGVETMRTHMHTLAREGAGILTKAWGTSLAAPEDMFSSMSLIKLPAAIHSLFDNIDYSAGETIQNRLFHDFNIEVPIKCVQGHLYVRISAHIHNDLQDYEKLAKAINMISQDKGNKLL